MSTVSAEAEHMIGDLGWAPVVLKPRSKAPLHNDWPNRVIDLADVRRLFEPDRNLGLRLGDRSKNVVDVDNDWPEARVVAPYLLPPTDAMFGRPSARMAHWLYTSPDLVADATLGAAIFFKDPLLEKTNPKEAMIVELRIGGTAGAQTMMPPSVHPTGEVLAWENGHDKAPLLVAGGVIRIAVSRVAAAALLARYWPKGSGMHNAARLLGGLLARNGWATGEITVFVEAICRAANDPDVKDRVRTAKDAAKAFDDGKHAQGIPTLAATFGDEITKEIVSWLGLRSGGGTAAGSTGHLPSIQLGPNLTETAIAAEQAVLAAGLPVWRRDVALVHPVVVSARGSDNRKTKTGVLAPISPILMRSYMEQAAQFERYDARRNALVRVKPPGDIAELMLDRAGHSPFAPICGLILAPSLRPDGSLLVRPGYDPDTELYLIDPPPMAPIADRSSRDEAQDALNLLCGLLTGFPFGDETAKAVALSGLITPVVRAALGRVPLHCFSAPAPGTGKSYLVDLCSTLATGFVAPVTSFGKDEAELEKSLGAVLIAAHPIISLDNISRPVKSDFLCRMIERPAVRVRVLGLSKTVLCEPQVVTFMTGNNLLLVGDIIRRSLLCGIDAESEAPWLRKFSQAPLKQIASDRGSYIRAALIVCRAFLTSGEPPIKPALASFEEWSNVVRSALVWLGCSDPAATIAVSHEEDPERQAFAAVLIAWETTLGALEITAAELVRRASERDLRGLLAPALYEALLGVAANRDGTISHSRLGYWLRAHRDQVLHGRVLRSMGTSRTGVVRWKLT